MFYNVFNFYHILKLNTKIQKVIDFKYHKRYILYGSAIIFMGVIDMEGIMYKVRDSFAYAKPSEESVAAYILKKPEEVVSMTINELAKASYASPSAIIRYCRSLGYKGFKDFKLKLSGDLTVFNLHDLEKKNLTPNDSVHNIMSTITHANIQSLYSSLQLIQEDQLIEAYQSLAEAQKIDFYGIGASFLIAHDAMQKFMRINQFCTAYSDIHMQKVSAVNLDEKAVAVAISYSGETKQIIDCVKIAQSKGAFVIAITKYANSTLSKIADSVLFVAAHEEEFRSAAMSSRIASLNLIDILYTACAYDNYDDSLAHLNQTFEIVDQDKREENKDAQKNNHRET